MSRFAGLLSLHGIPLAASRIAESAGDSRYVQNRFQNGDGCSELVLSGLAQNRYGRASSDDHFLFNFRKSATGIRFRSANSGKRINHSFACSSELKRLLIPQPPPWKTMASRGETFATLPRSNFIRIRSVQWAQVSWMSTVSFG